MTLDEWYLDYETEMQRHHLALRELTRLLPDLVRLSQPEPSSDGVVASTNTPDVPGQERLNLQAPLDLIV